MPSSDRLYVELDLMAIEQRVFQICGQLMRAVMEMTHSMEMLVYWPGQCLWLLSNLMLQSSLMSIYHRPFVIDQSISCGT